MFADQERCEPSKVWSMAELAPQVLGRYGISAEPPPSDRKGRHRAPQAPAIWPSEALHSTMATGCQV